MSEQITIQQKFEDYMQAKGLSYTPDPNLNAYAFAYTGASASWTCAARIREEHQQFVLYSFYPLETPPEQMQPMMEFVLRVNFALLIGSFMLDLNDGEIRFKTGIDFGQHPPSQRLIHQVFAANLITMDRYFAGIGEVLGGAAPTEVLAQIRGGA